MHEVCTYKYIYIFIYTSWFTTQKVYSFNPATHHMINICACIYEYIHNSIIIILNVNNGGWSLRYIFV